MTNMPADRLREPPKQFNNQTDDLSKIIRDGVEAAWPVCLGYVPIGLALGVLAQQAGLTPFEIGLMSLLVFAGSAQFIAVSMLAGGAFIPIIITVFTVNLRHLLMSSSLAVHLRGLSLGRLSLFAYGITDESFALNMTRFREANWDWRRALVLNHAANLAWVSSTFIGGYGGQFIPAGAFGIDYALPAMFICLLVFQLRGAIYMTVAIIAGLLAVLCAFIFPGNIYIVLASTAAATVGVILQKRSEKPSEETKDI